MQNQETYTGHSRANRYHTAEKLIGTVGYGAALRYCYAEQWLGVAQAICQIRRRHRCQ